MKGRLIADDDAVANGMEGRDGVGDIGDFDSCNDDDVILMLIGTFKLFVLLSLLTNDIDDGPFVASWPFSFALLYG